MEKRYQYIGRGGEVKWTKWFEWDSDLQDPWQLDGKLKNEYR